jgi:hypothetical protein
MPQVLGTYLELNVGTQSTDIRNSAYLELNIGTQSTDIKNTSYLEINVGQDMLPDTHVAYLELNVVQFDVRLHQFSTGILGSGAADARLHQFGTSVLGAGVADTRLQQYSVAVLAKEIQIQLQAGIWKGSLPMGLQRQFLVEVLADSPLFAHVYDTESGSTVSDLSGNGLDGTYSGSPTFGAAGIINGYSTSSEFDGTDDWVSVTHSSLLNLTSGWTLETIFRPGATVTTAEGALAGMVFDGTRVNPSLRVASGGGIAAGFYNGAWRLTPGSYTPQANTTVHLAGRWNGTTLSLVVNGVQVSQGNPGSSPSAYASGAFRISRRWDGTMFYRARWGMCAVYPNALSDARLLAHAQAAGLA